MLVPRRLFTYAALLSSLVLAAGCSPVPKSQQGLMIGSSTSKNLFLDSSQFANRKVKLRLRNSSGDPGINMSRVRGAIEAGLRDAGYQVVDSEDFGILVDVNMFQLQSAAATRVRDSSGLGTLLGAVAGFEATRRNSNSGVAVGSGVILGAVAGYKLEEIIRANSEVTTYVALSDVNIGVVRRESTAKDSFTIGGNKYVHKDESESPTFKGFALRDTIRVAVYAGDDFEKRNLTVDAILDRLGRVVSNLI